LIIVKHRHPEPLVTADAVTVPITAIVFCSQKRADMLKSTRDDAIVVVHGRGE